MMPDKKDYKRFSRRNQDANTPKTILVGTYRLGMLEEWQDYYNYPIFEDDAVDRESCKKVNELWLFNGVKSQRTFAVEFIGVKTRRELTEKYAYPSRGTPHAKEYLLFRRIAETPYSVENVEKVIVRLKDFVSKSPHIASQLKDFLSSEERGECEYSGRVPFILTTIPSEKILAADAALQLDFFPQLLKPENPLPPTMKHTKPRLTFFDLFAGCGGLSLGLERAGFTPLLVNELNPDAMSTYLLNRRDEFPWLCDNNVYNVKDLVLDESLLEKFRDSIKRDFSLDVFNGELDLICGGPPCQGFSGLGIRRSYSVEKKQLPSNYLYQDMAFLVNKLRPKIFLFENVRGLLSAKWTNNGEKGEIFRDVLKTFSEIGAYHVRHKLVLAKDYGVPQNRPRILIVGLRKDVFSAPQMQNDAVTDGFLPHPVGGYPSIGELLGDLIDPSYSRGASTKNYPRPPLNDVQRRLRTKRDGSVFQSGDPVSEMEYSNHSEFIVEKFTEMIKNGGEIPERFKTKKFAQRVLPREWGSAGPTITACSAPDDYVHFEQPRSLTVREWARLQTFPDWYVFAGKRTTGGLRRAGNPREGIFDRELPKYTQIGNAVPVELAYNIGRHFAKLLEEGIAKPC